MAETFRAPIGAWRTSSALGYFVLFVANILPLLVGSGLVAHYCGLVVNSVSCLFSAMNLPRMMTDDPRLDKWLWSVRVFKTRAEATAACRAGKVLIGDLEAKPGRDIHLGEMVTVRVGTITRSLKVTGRPRSRVGAKLLTGYVQDLTPAAEYERAKQASREHMLARQRGKGRPTKKDRREMGRLFGFE